MYSRRVLIFSRQDNLYASCGSLCGMAKFSINGNQTQVCVFVSNLQMDEDDKWWGVVLVDGKMYKSKLPHVNNFCFDLPTTALENVGFVLSKQHQDGLVVVAQGFLGNRKINAFDKDKLRWFLMGQGTKYEDFVATTPNYYPNDVQVDVAKLKRQSQQGLVALHNYSAAFERYYAVGRGDNYLQSVKAELEELFGRFPPFYPLMEKYKESYFVRIDFPQTDKFFAVGLITREGHTKYICYALPAEKQTLQDKDFAFVEKDGKGFWMLCQDSATGQITTLQV